MNAAGWFLVITLGLGTVRWMWQRTMHGGARCPEGRGLYPECLYRVTVSEDEIVVRRPDDSVARVSLAELTQVTIETNDSGPLGSDVWWHWYGSLPGVACSYPQGATGEGPALALVQTLQNFKNEALTAAMRCASNEVFVVYQRTTQ